MERTPEPATILEANGANVPQILGSSAGMSRRNEAGLSIIRRHQRLPVSALPDRSTLNKPAAVTQSAPALSMHIKVS